MVCTKAIAVLVATVLLGASASSVNVSAPIEMCVCCNYGGGNIRTSAWCGSSLSKCDGALGGWCACNGGGCKLPDNAMLNPTAVWRQVVSTNYGSLTYTFESGMSYTSGKTVSSETSNTLSVGVKEKLGFDVEGVGGGGGLETTQELKETLSKKIEHGRGTHDEKGCTFETPEESLRDMGFGWSIFQWTITATDGFVGGEYGERVTFATCDYLVVPQPYKPKCELTQCADTWCQTCRGPLLKTLASGNSSPAEVTGRASPQISPPDIKATLHAASHVNLSDPINACVCRDQGGGYRRRSKWCQGHGSHACDKLGGWEACTDDPHGKVTRCIKPDPVVVKPSAAWQWAGSFNAGTHTIHSQRGVTEESSSSVTEGTARSFSSSVSAGFEFEGSGKSVSMSHTFMRSLSTSITLSGTTFSQHGCEATFTNMKSSKLGYAIYQWGLTAESNGKSLMFDSCDFLLIPKELTQKPQCPVGCCQDIHCQQCIPNCSPASAVSPETIV